jgi:hypothetical protein
MLRALKLKVLTIAVLHPSLRIFAPQKTGLCYGVLKKFKTATQNCLRQQHNRKQIIVKHKSLCRYAPEL